MTEKEQMKTFYITERDLALAENSEISYPLWFSKDELEPVKQIKKADDLMVYLTSYPSEDSYVVKIEIAGKVLMADGKYKDMDYEDYLTFAQDESLSDVEFSKGKYDLMPAVKALFYAGAPKEDKPAKDAKRPTGDFGYMSVEEYRAKKKKDAEKQDESKQTYRPFADLKEMLKAEKDASKANK